MRALAARVFSSLLECATRWQSRTAREPTQTGPDPSPQAELRRLRSEAAFHQRLRDLTVAFSGDVSSSLSLEAALQTLAADANALLGATRTSVWLHQRRARRLILVASSEADPATEVLEVETGDPEAPAARGMRLEHPELTGDGPGLLLLAPLRGWRRALGTLVVEGPRTGDLEPGQLTSLTRELTRQLSAVIENIQLLEEILRQRRLLEDTFNSILDLVVVTDNQLHVVQTNDAFAERTGDRARGSARSAARLAGRRRTGGMGRGAGIRGVGAGAAAGPNGSRIRVSAARSWSR